MDAETPSEFSIRAPPHLEKQQHMTVSAIVAVAKNGVIGSDNQIPWHLPNDLRFFKKHTTGHHVIMGRVTYLSLGRPLPNRTNVVITRNPHFVAEGCMVVNSIEEALALALKNGETEAFIIGGATIYEAAMPYLDRIYLTEVDLEPKGDTQFFWTPDGQWTKVFSEHFDADERNKAGHTFNIFEKQIVL